MKVLWRALGKGREKINNYKPGGITTIPETLCKFGYLTPQKART